MILNLYNILKSILTEDVNPTDVASAIDNRVRVLVNYEDDKKRAPGGRLIEPYVYGLSKAGNPVLRAYQYNGDTARGVPKWKLFRLDRFTNWTPTDQHFNLSPRENGWKAEDYNSNGDGSMVQVFNQVSFDSNSDTYSPNNRLNNIRKQRDNMQNSTPINANNTNPSGPINNKSFQDMLKRNLEITAQEKERSGFSMDSLNFDSVKRGPVIPNDNETISQARRRRKKETDREAENRRKEKRQMSMADKYKLRSPKKYRNNNDESLNDVDF